MVCSLQDSETLNCDPCVVLWFTQDKAQELGEKEYVLSMDSVKEKSFVIMIVKYQLDTFKYFCLEFLVLGTWSHILPLINGRYL